MISWRNHLLVAGALTGLALLVFAQSIPGDFLNWDDNIYVTENPELELPLPAAVGHVLTTSLVGNYNPLQRLVYLVEWRAFGANPLPFRLTSLLLHALAAYLLFRVLAEWLGRSGPALLAAALFLVHPANVENAAWVSELKTLLAVCFAFGAILAWLRDRRWTALALFTVGLFAKTSIVVVPVLLPLLDLSRRRRPDWARTIAFFVPAVVMGILQIRAARADDAILSLHGGTLATHLATVAGVLPRYLQGLILPFGAACYHPFEPVTSAWDARLFGGVLLLAAAVVAVVRSWRGERRMFVAVPWFFLVLLPTIVVPIPILYAERYLYLAMAFLVGVAADRAFALSSGRERLTSRAAAVAVLVAFATGSFLYAGTWASSIVMWERAASVHPEDSVPHVWLANARFSAGDVEGAERAFRRAVEVNPGDAEIATGLAMTEMAIGRVADARRRLERVVAESPETGPAWAHLGKLLDRTGDETGARQVFRRGLAVCPAESLLWKLYGEFEGRHGRAEAADRALVMAERLGVRRR